LSADNLPRPLVSLIALCYNHARFARQCLESVLAQTYEVTELIIMDDASRDDSVRIIHDWIAERKVRCRFIAHEKNAGVCASLNEALAYATGKYVSMVSTDDVWELDKLERQVPLMEAAPDDVAVLYSDAWRMDEAGVRVPGFFIASHRQFEAMPSGAIFPIMWEGNFIPAMTTLIRRSCLEAVGKYDERLIYEDWDMWLRLSEAYQFIYSPFPSATYRLMPNSLVHVLAEHDNAWTHYSGCILQGRWLEKFRPDRIRYRTAITRFARHAEHLYRLGHPRAGDMLALVRRHAGGFRKLGRPRAYVMAACAAMHVPYRVFAAMDATLLKPFPPG
jgi:glycosyltransferase involved in cell wall biosynthesis